MQGQNMIILQKRCGMTTRKSYVDEEHTVLCQHSGHSYPNRCLESSTRGSTMLLLYQELPNQNSIIFGSLVAARGGVRVDILFVVNGIGI